MTLLKRFKDFVNKEHLFTVKDTLLLAVSGGVDSVVLCELCYQGGYDFVIAHCNFQLRGEESERDEAFVRELGKKYGKEVVVKRFDTQQYATQQKVSIQVAARELRYAWFEEIVGRESSIANPGEPGNRKTAIHQASRTADPGTPNAKLRTILTAHHLDDNIETLLMKFFKGTGIAGLRGILPRQGKLLRPLLFAKKEELVQFAGDNKLLWVEDSSNAQDKYARNYLRHQVLPLLQQLYPDVVNNLADNLARFREVEGLYHQAVESHKKKLLEYKGNEIHIPVLKLQRSEPLGSLLYEITKPYGFSAAQIPDIIHLLDSESGRYMVSATHRIIKNRNWLIIAPLEAAAANHIIIEENDTAISFAGGYLQLSTIGVADIRLPAVDSIGLADRKHIHFPLLLRPWKAGDYFYPLGMQKKKKISRFLIDQKLSKTAKEKVWVLESNKKIIWVAGMRIDDRFKITGSTQQVLRMELKM
jgi:tRNA(Ile)-lysidine synthase